MTEQVNNSKILSLKQASELSGYHQDYLGQLCRSGKLRSTKVGKGWVTSESALNEFLGVQNLNNILPDVPSQPVEAAPVEELPVSAPTTQKIPVRVIAPVNNANELFEKAESETVVPEPVIQTPVPITTLPVETPEPTPVIPEAVQTPVVPEALGATAVVAGSVVGATQGLAKAVSKPSMLPKVFSLFMVLVALVSGTALLALNPEFQKSFAGKNKVVQAPIAPPTFIEDTQSGSDININQPKSETDLPPATTLPASTTPVVINNYYQPSAQSLASLEESISKIVFQLFDSKQLPLIQGETGPIGPEGPKGDRGPISVTNINLPTSYDQLIITALTGDDATFTDDVTIGDDLIVSGTITAAGISGTIDPSFTLGSVAFQGATGLDEDNANFFWDDASDYLGLGTNTPSYVIDVQGSDPIISVESTSTNGDAVIRMESHRLGVGNEWTFGPGVGASHQAFAFLTTTGAITAMSLSQTGQLSLGTESPSAKLHVLSTTEQLRLGYDAANYTSLTTSSTGATTFSFNGSAPQAVFIPQVDSGSAFDFQDSAGDSLFRIDTSGRIVNVGENDGIAKFNIDATITSDTGFTYGQSINVNADNSLFGGVDALNIQVGGAFAGSASTNGIRSFNNLNSTATQLFTNQVGNSGVMGFVSNSTAGHNAGLLGLSIGSSSLNSGVFGSALSGSNSALRNIGIVGQALNATNNIGGYFYLGSTTPAGFTSTALLANNGSESAPIFVAQDNGSQVLIIADGGNVGIGTDTSPAAALTIGADGGAGVANGAGDLYVQNDLEVDGTLTVAGATTYSGALSVITTTSPQLTVGYDSSNKFTTAVASDGGTTWAMLGTDADLNVDFSGATDGDFSINTDDLFVDTSTGNVGIGTASPASTQRLSVVSPNDDIDGGAIFYANNLTQNLEVGYGGIFSTVTGAGQQFRIGMGANGGAGTIIFQNNVAIGEINATSKLDVAGGISIGSYAGATAAPTNGVIISGNVGIGTASPGSQLDVIKDDNDIDSIARFYPNNLTQGIGISYRGILGLGTDSSILIEANGTGRISLANATIIGGGSFTSSAKLAVYGSQSIGAGYQDIDPPTDGLIVLGNVGIGTASPDGKLEIAGNISSAAWGLNGIQLQGTAATFTDSSTAASGTATNAVFTSFGQPTLAASNLSVTTTNAATVYIAAAPAAGTNQTITNAYALWVDAGTSRFDGYVTAPGAGGLPDQSERFGYNSAAGMDGTALGFSASAGAAGVAIGKFASTATSSVAVGQGAHADSFVSTAIGSGANEAFGYGIALGYGATSTTTNQFIAGSNTAAINSVYIGNGVTNTSPVSFILQGSGGSGADVPGASVTIAGGKGTGNAAGGDILFQTSDAGVSSSTLQSLTTKLIVKTSGNVGIGATSPGAKLEVASEQSFSYPTMGLGKGTIHLSPVAATNDDTTAITFGGSSAGTLINSGQAGIYVQSSSAYGTKMYFGTSSVFGTGSEARMMIDQLGNIGIADITPDASLEVVNDGSGDSFLVADTNDGDATPFVIQADGDVGVGTAAPVGKFSVQSGISAASMTLGSTTGISQSLNLDGTGWGMYFGLDTVTGNGWIQQGRTSASTAYNLLLQASGGNVGIGTVSPGALLDIGTNAEQTVPRLRVIGYSDTMANIEIGDGASVYWKLRRGSGNDITMTYSSLSMGNSGISDPAPGTTYDLKIGGTNASIKGLAVLRDSFFAGLLSIGADVTPDANLEINNDSSGDSFLVNDGGDGDTTPFVIQGDGNVGIGTVSPQNKLDIEGGAVIGATYSGTNTAPTNGLLVEGNVGIGTISPVGKFSVTSGVSAASMTLGSTTGISQSLNLDGTGWGMYFGLDTVTGNGWIQQGRTSASTAYNLLLQASGGNVGIGTTGPTEKLSVVAGTLSSGLGALKVSGTFPITSGVTAYGANFDFTTARDSDTSTNYAVNIALTSSYVAADGAGREVGGLKITTTDPGGNATLYGLKVDSAALGGTTSYGVYSNAAFGGNNSYGVYGTTQGGPQAVGVYGESSNTGGTRDSYGGMFKIVGNVTQNAYGVYSSPANAPTITGTYYGMYSTINGATVTGAKAAGLFTDGTTTSTFNNGTYAALFAGGNVSIGSDTSPGAAIVVGSDATMGVANGAGDAYIQSDLEVDGSTTTALLTTGNVTLSNTTTTINSVNANPTISFQGNAGTFFEISRPNGNDTLLTAQTTLRLNSNLRIESEGKLMTGGGLDLFVDPDTTGTLVLGALTTSETTHVIELAESTVLRSGESLQWTTGIIDTAGNVGIGTISPDAKLEIAGNLSSAAWGVNGIQLQATAATYTDSSTGASGTATNAVFTSFGLPTLAASNTSVTTTYAANVYIAAAPANGTNQTITNPYAFWIDDGESRFDSGVGIGVENPAYMLEVDYNGAGIVARFTDNDGSCDINPTNTALDCASDARLKKNITTLNSSLEKVLQFRGVHFKWNSQTDDALRIGFIAQEVESVFPELVRTDSETGYKSVNYTGFAPILVNAIKEQQEEIEALQQALNSLQGNPDGNISATKLSVKEHLYFNEDVVGQAKILSGSNTVRVSFKEQYEAQPIVTITPMDFVTMPYKVTEVDATGFTIELFVKADTDITFSWHSFGGEGAKLSVSDGSKQDIELIAPVPVVLAPEPDPVPEFEQVQPDEPGLPTSEIVGEAVPLEEIAPEAQDGTAESMPQISEVPDTGEVIMQEGYQSESGEGVPTFIESVANSSTESTSVRQ